MNRADRNKLRDVKPRLSLMVYDRPEDARVPDYCADLRVYGLCEDDEPVVYVFSEEMKLRKAA